MSSAVGGSGCLSNSDVVAVSEAVILTIATRRIIFVGFAVAVSSVVKAGSGRGQGQGGCRQIRHPHDALSPPAIG
jgi:hypothetical protein